MMVNKMSFSVPYYIVIVLVMAACMICRGPCQAYSESCKEIMDNITYPFGIEGDDGSTKDSGKAASRQFLISNCVNTSDGLYPHWNSLMDENMNSMIGPSVLSINYESSKVNLSWDANGTNTNSCSIFPSESVSSLLPISIDFRQSSNLSGIQVSSNSIFLLFNCTNIDLIRNSNYLDSESSKCRSFLEKCNTNVTCTEFNPQYQLRLNEIMNQTNCTHFQFLVTRNPSLNILQWIPHVLELSWNNNSLPWAQACLLCTSTNGTCGYDSQGSRFRCFCSNNRSSETDCLDLNGGGTKKHKVIIALAASLVCVMIIVIALSGFVVHMRSKTNKDLIKINSANNSGGKLLAELRTLFSSGNNKGSASTHEFSYQELMEATHSFAYDNMIGNGGFGAVYVGTLRDGRKVAIKKLFYENFQRTTQFRNEIHILSQLNHLNLVKLYGFCCQDEKDLLLVFEYVCNGSLFDQLHESNSSQVLGSKRINCWKVRLQIAWEVAEALLYLHKFSSPPIFHRDVKTSNILLDEDFHAKLADFGISRTVPNEATHISTIPQGTPGYVDPEYHTYYRLTDKSDVFSFGVVLMELLSGRKAVDMFAKSENEINLSNLTLSKVADGTWHELLDQSCWASNHHCNSLDLAHTQYGSDASHHKKCISMNSTSTVQSSVGLENSNSKMHNALCYTSELNDDTLSCFSVLQKNNLNPCKNPIAQCMLALAFRCLQPASANRPHMQDVVEALYSLRKQSHVIDCINIADHEPIVLDDASK